MAAAGPSGGGGRRAIAVVIALVAVAAVAGLVWAGQGARPAANAPGSTTATATDTPTPATVDSQCATQLGALVSGLEDLDSRLSVGLNFADYSQRVGDVKVAYDKVTFSGLSATCISRAGVPAENALNEYIAALNAWSDCFNKAGCTSDSVKPTLQGHWSKASSEIQTTKEAMP